jgi:hypothetical protein
MPYNRHSGRMENAKSTGHVPIAQSEFVKEQLRSFRVAAGAERPQVDNRLLTAAGALGEACADPMRWAISFDGSPQEVPVREQYPSTRIGYIQVAAVLVHLEEMFSQEIAQFVDPAVIHAATSEALHSIVLPSSNVCRNDMNSVRDSWRAEIFEVFRDYQVEETSLLEIFMRLVGFSDKGTGQDEVILARCSASETCDAKEIAVPTSGSNCSKCSGQIFPTDALRVHEEISEEHPNITALGRLMTVLEHITMVGYLHFLFQRQPRVLGTVAFVIDGPLALFGPQAWLHTPILAFIHDLRSKLEAQHLGPPVLVGLEKTGQFAEHAAAIGESIPRQTLMALPNNYIYSHILTFRPTASAEYGRDTYYGQKFFYRTAQGQMLTMTIPKPSGAIPDLHDTAHYPMLRDTLAFLDRIGTALYQDAVIPVALAHSFASIPLRTGSKVLKLLSQQFLSGAL